MMARGSRQGWWSGGCARLGFAPLLAAAALAALPLGAAAPLAPAPAELKLETLDPDLFPLPDELTENVTFWTDVFARYSSDQVVIHDEWHPERIYAVLDFTEVENSTLSDVAKERRREDAVRAELAKIEGILRHLAAGQDSVYTADAERISALLPNAGKPGFLTAVENLRVQTGLKDHFAAALERAGRYIPGIERLFEARGLPTELARLPFIESMFQTRARSKVAAGGIWQLMPGTGRRFLRVANDVDERYDPLLAAEAAAAVLAENFALLKTWPLALTAYNHGPYGVKKAVETLATRDLGTIYTHYQGKSFGFASRNFYAEFIAAATLYANRAHHFPEVVPWPELTFDELVLDRYIPIPALATKAGLSLAELQELNPAVDDDVWSGRLRLPAGYRLRVPLGQRETFRVAYAELPAELKVARQSGGQHRVRGGETLSTIARRYGVSVAALQQANRLGRRTTVRVGQVLAIPGGRLAPSPPPAVAPVRVAVAAPPPGAEAPAAQAGGTAVPAAPDPKPSAKVHVVRKGETLYGIAQRYGMSVKTLMRTNGLTSAHKIYPGQRLSLAR